MNNKDKEISIPNQLPISVVPVTSLGNSWIICRSKTYAGRVYYFNTLTGEAVWNLSETEKAIAKKKTLESQTEFRNTEFPEPLDSPIDENIEHTGTGSIYNKQILNNQFPRLPYPIPDVNFEQCTPVHAFNAISLPYAPFINVPSNPIIWTQATKYDIKSSINMKYDIPKNNQTFNTSIPLSMRFQNLQDGSRFHKKRYIKKSFKHKIHHDYNLSSSAVHTDLRNKLSNLRTMKGSQDNPGQIGGFNNSNTFTYGKVHLADDIHNEDCSATDDSMVTNLVNVFSEVGMTYNLSAQSGRQSHAQETMDYEFNITPLKALFEINSKTKLWFLVIDKDVLFNNLNFISKLIRLDDKCRLIVPKVVLNEVQKATTSVERTESRRSLQAAVFISKMLNDNRAVVDKEDHNTNEYCKNIIECCLNLSRKDLKVVLVTEKDSFKEYNINSFSIFTINELKHFLIYGKLKDTPLQEETLPSLQTDEKSTITITIHNNNVQEERLQEGLREDECMNYESEILPKNKDMAVQTENVSHFVDAGVQTESFENYLTSKTPVPILVSKESEETHQIRTTTDGKYSKWRRRNIHLRDRSGVIMNKKATSESDTMPIKQQNSGMDQGNFLHIQNADNDGGNVMFEVSSKAMEEYLQMKSDEWVSRFIQIMEEALTQILQLDPPFVSDMPPPWTIYEASECIKRKFCNEPDVVDAANKLGDILFEIGGLRGKINEYVTPKCYMKLYSYGVYLIDALQGPMSNNEDLHIAEKSLAKLLSDIQEPHLDSSYYDTFTDIDAPTLSVSNATNDKDTNKNSQETHLSNSAPVVNITTPSKELSDIKISRALSVTEDNYQDQTFIKSLHKQAPRTPQRTLSLDQAIEKTPETPKSQSEKLVSPQQNIRTPTKYLLRHRKNNKKEPEHNIERHYSPKQNFLKNFNLLDVVEGNASVEIPLPQTPNSDENNENDRNQVETEETTNNDKNNCSSFDTETTSGPKIIRNFTRCIEFEDRLQRKCDFYSEEFSDEEYDDAYLEGSNMSYYEDMDPNEFGLDSDSVVTDKSVEKVKACKSFIDKIGAHIKQNFQLIISFCKDSRKRLMSECDESEKQEIQMKAKKVAIFMDNLCLDLKRIYKRESCDSQLGVRHFLIKLGLEGNEIDEKELEHYRSFINECIIQGANLQNTLKLLIEATQEV